MFGRRIAEKVIVLGVIASMEACSSDSPNANAIGTTQEAIAGGDTHDVTVSAELPEVAVGQITVTVAPGDPLPFNSCTASVIGRGVVLTAAHCFCHRDRQSLELNPLHTTFSIARVGSAETVMISVVNIGVKFFNTVNDLCTTSDNEERAVSDLAIVLLQRPLTSVELPSLENVYTSGDFLDRLKNSTPTQPPFFAAPIEIVGFAGTLVRKKGTVTSDINFESSCGFLQLGDCSPNVWIDYDDDGITAHHEEGDSGGPITFRLNGLTPTQFGVVKGFVHDPGTEDMYSPTWDNGQGNGGFIRGFLPDADHDGVEDSGDNCPPFRCPYNVDACANADQADRDGDGIGDACDNCDPALCDARGWSVAACANPDQFDADKDGTGDECDSCALVANGATMHDPSILTQQLDDQDHDGVGDACDNCNQPNGYQVCQTTADCGSGGGECNAVGKLGNCVGGETPNTACGAAGPSFGECGSGTCANLGTFGRCAFQTDDPDHDGIGGQCDACPNNPDTRINANSNIDEEQRLSVSALGDLCDPVPVYVSRPNLGVTGDPLGSTENYTTFFSTAGVGEGGQVVLGSTGFRYCSCFGMGGVALDRAHCMTQCPVAPSQFNSMTSNWVPISTATLGSLAVPPSSTAATIDQRLIRDFNSTINCNDNETHFVDLGEICRIGGSQEILKWFHQADIDRGVVQTDDLGHTSGIFWSHVLTGTLFASTRDSSTTGMLRDDYESVVTPFVPIQLPTPAGAAPKPCVGSGCVSWWHSDWLADPAEFVGDPSALQQVAYVARLLPGANQTVVAVRSGAEAEVDVTSALSDQVRNLMTNLSGQVGWLSPIEPAARGRAPGAIVGAVMATPWRQSSVAPAPLTFKDGTLGIPQLVSNKGGNGFIAAVSTVDPPHYVPADRDGARALFSSREGSVYMMGGHFLSGSATHEVWKYDFSSQAWTHVFLPAQNGNLGPAMGDAIALTYDDVNHRILMIDEIQPTMPDLRDPKREHRFERPTSQLLEFDTKTQTIRSLLRLPRTGLFERVSLATQDDGSYVLVGALRDRRWIAFRLEITAHRGQETVRWTGVAQGDGEVLDDPIRVTEGNILPVLRNGQQELVTLSNASFDHSGRRCDAL